MIVRLHQVVNPGHNMHSVWVDLMVEGDESRFMYVATHATETSTESLELRCYSECAQLEKCVASSTQLIVQVCPV